MLFDRCCSSMGLYGGAICVAAKVVGRTRWDHTGVVVHAPLLAPTASSREDELFVLEATVSGVKLRPLVARVLREVPRSLLTLSPMELVVALADALPSGIYTGEGVEAYTREVLTADGRTDDFRQLANELYIAATDLDTCERIVLGAEGAGLGRLVRTRCDVVAAIPLAGRLGSLNVAAAGALACFEVARRRSEVG